MYGYFNHAFEMFITTKYGGDEWEIIRDMAGLFHDHFDDEITYDDNMIYEILDAASEYLDVDGQELQEEFGEMYFDHCLASSHGSFLKKLGGNLFDFFSNLDGLHDYLTRCYADAKIPSLNVERTDDRKMTVTYFSDRDDLESIIPGIIRQAAKVLFNLNVETTRELMPYKTILVYAKEGEDIRLMFPKKAQLPRTIIPAADEPKVSPFEFAKIFPFHMVFDENMCFVELGAALSRILNVCSNKAEYITNYFTVTRPQVQFDFDSITLRLNNSFVLTTIPSNKSDLPRSNLSLKGQMILLERRPYNMLLFLCSPSITSIEDMTSKGLCLSDIPIHDATRDLVLLSENIQKELKLTQQLGIVSDHLKKIHAELHEELVLYTRLLYAVLPSSIAKILGEGNQVHPEKFECVTLMFSGIVDFSVLCQNYDAKLIVAMLNDLYIRFDDFIRMINFVNGEMHEWVYKVETIGDKYMTASGVPDKTSNNPTIMCSLALDMHDAAQSVFINNTEPIKVTFGIHSGEVVASVIGKKMPRYCLFGNSVNLASRTETTGLPGKINVTECTYSSIDFEGCNNPDYEKIRNFYFERRGPVKMKGKSDPMITYTLRRRHPRPMPPSHPMNPPPPRNDSTDVISSPSNNQNFFSLHRKPHAYEGAGQRRFRKHRRSNMLGRFSASSGSLIESSYSKSRGGSWYSSFTGGPLSSFQGSLLNDDMSMSASVCNTDLVTTKKRPNHLFEEEEEEEEEEEDKEVERKITVFKREYREIQNDMNETVSLYSAGGTPPHNGVNSRRASVAVQLQMVQRELEKNLHLSSA